MGRARLFIWRRATIDISINTWTLYARYVMPHRHDHEAVKTVPRCRGSEGQMCMFANSGKVFRAPPNTTTFTLL